MIVFIGLSQNAARGATIQANSASSSDVQTAINSASSGDTVQVPAGNATWTTAVTISGKALNLIGAGGGATVITDGTGGGAISVNGCSSANFVRISGFGFQSQGSHTSSGMINISGVTFSTGFRIDNCYFLISSAITRGITTSDAYGVIDHCAFNTTATSGSVQCISPWGSSDGTDGGFTPWLHYAGNFTLGDSNAVFIENNSFTDSPSDAGTEDCIDGYGGARIVVRYNSFTNYSQGFHGTDSGNRRSIISFEIYSNNYVNNSSISLRAATIRGGTGVVFGNTYGGSQSWYGVTLMYYRACPALDHSTWGLCDGTQYLLGSTSLSSSGSRTCSASGTVGFNVNDNETLGAFGGLYVRYFDGNGPGGYPGRDQPGMAPGQILKPIYVWNNNGLTAGTYDGGSPPALGIANYILAGRDYVNSSTPPSGYVPYVYPHPLIGGAVTTNPPSISSQPVNATALVGQSTLFTVTASGSGTLSYQWYWYGTNVLGAILSSWTTPPALLGNSNSPVYVTVGNAYGTVTSSIAHLYVTSGVAPAITTNPASQTIAAGGSAVFTVAASGTTPMAYQWRFNSAAIAGATNKSYTVAPVGTNNAGGYSTTVANSYGSVTSQVATLTVTASTQTVHYYYVAPNGNDANNGSIGSPWATVNHATASMAGGDVLYIRGGTYSQIFDIYGPSGSASYPTIVQAYPGESPVFNYNNITSSGHSLDGLNWFVLSGLTIISNNIGLYVGALGACSNVVLTNLTIAYTGQQGLQIYKQSYNVLVVSNTVHDTGLWNLNGEGMYIGVGDQSPPDNTHNITITGCSIYNTKDEAVELKPGTYNNVVQYCTIHTANKSQDAYGAGGGAIEVNQEGSLNYYSGNPNHLVRGNLIYDTPIGIRAGNGGQYYNNVIYAVTGDGILIDNQDSDTYTRYVYNNTVDASSSIAIVRSAGTASILNNIGPTGSYNLATSAAYYVNAAAHNYHLVQGSAPIQAGTNVFSVVTADYDGNTRPQSGPFDIAAYQYQVTGVLSPPTNLHIVSSQ
jgi:hypothetical protein